MQAINSAIGALLDALLWPFQGWPLAGLTVVSLLVSLGLLAAFKITSNQRALAAAKRRMQANLFELRLFQDDPRLVMRVVGELLRQQAVYLRYAFVPLLWVALPLAILAAHLEARYGYDGLRPGHAALLTVRMKPSAGPPTRSEAGAGVGNASGGAAGHAARPALRLEAPSDLRVETPGVWAAPLREMAWRIAAEREGDYELRISSAVSAVSAATGVTGATGATGATAPMPAADVTAGSIARDAVTKRVRVTPLIVARQATRPSPSIWNQLWMPAEAPLPADSPIEAIDISYPERAIRVFGFPLDWVAVFVVLSMLSAILLRRVFNVVL
jgi:hypothetical protein